MFTGSHCPLAIRVEWENCFLIYSIFLCILYSKNFLTFIHRASAYVGLILSLGISYMLISFKGRFGVGFFPPPSPHTYKHMELLLLFYIYF